VVADAAASFSSLRRLAQNQCFGFASFIRPCCQWLQECYQLFVIATIAMNTDEQPVIFKQSLQVSKQIRICLPPLMIGINTDEL
jgi:hypothetical protein